MNFNVPKGLEKLNPVKISKTVKTTAKAAIRATKENAPLVLTGIAVGSLVVGGVAAIKATVKATREYDKMLAARKKELEEEHQKIDEAIASNPAMVPGAVENGVDPENAKLTKEQVVQFIIKVAPYYIPAACFGALSILATVASHQVSARRQAALAGLYTMSEEALKEYQKEVKEADPELQKKIEDKVLDQQVAKSDTDKETGIEQTGRGGILCYEPQTGRAFYSSPEAIDSAINQFNRCMLLEGMGSLNDLYEYLGLAPCEIGYSVGWTGYHLVDYHLTSRLNERQEPMLCVIFDTPLQGNLNLVYGDG